MVLKNLYFPKISSTSFLKISFPLIPLTHGIWHMVVSISEQIWSITFKQTLASHDLFVKHIRYMDNRLLFADRRIGNLAAYDVLIHEGFYGKPIILDTEPDQEFLGFMLECQPFELIYQGPTNISQGFIAALCFSSTSTFKWFSLPMSHRREGSLS